MPGKRGRPSYFKRTEELLREYKYMAQDIKNLERELEDAKEDLMPKVSTDLIKVGQGSTKTPFDTSQTERYGIRIAENKRVGGLEGLLRDTRRKFIALREIRAMLDKGEG